MKSPTGSGSPQDAVLRYKESFRYKLRRFWKKKIVKPISDRYYLWMLRSICRGTDQWDMLQIQLPWKENGRKVETTYYIYIGLAPPPDFLPKHFRKVPWVKENS